VEAPAGYPDQSLHDIRLVIGTPGSRHRIVSVVDGKSRLAQLDDKTYRKTSRKTWTTAVVPASQRRWVSAFAGMTGKHGCSDLP
jgi:hypothetical protein